MSAAGNQATHARTPDTHIISVPRFNLAQMLIEIKPHQSLSDNILLEDDNIPISDLARHTERRNSRSWSRQRERKETECEDGGGKHCRLYSEKGKGRGNGGGDDDVALSRETRRHRPNDWALGDERIT